MCTSKKCRIANSNCVGVRRSAAEAQLTPPRILWCSVHDQRETHNLSGSYGSEKNRLKFEPCNDYLVKTHIATIRSCRFCWKKHDLSKSVTSTVYPAGWDTHQQPTKMKRPHYCILQYSLMGCTFQKQIHQVVQLWSCLKWCPSLPVT